MYAASSSRIFFHTEGNRGRFEKNAIASMPQSPVQSVALSTHPALPAANWAVLRLKLGEGSEWLEASSPMTKWLMAGRASSILPADLQTFPSHFTAATRTI